MDAIYDILKMEDITDQYDSTEIQNQKALAIVVFILSFLFFLPFISYKDSALAKKISNQSFNILLAEIALSIISAIVGIIPFLGWLIKFVICVASFAFVVLKVIDMVNGKIRSNPYGFEIEIFK